MATSSDAEASLDSRSGVSQPAGQTPLHNQELPENFSFPGWRLSTPGPDLSTSSPRRKEIPDEVSDSHLLHSAILQVVNKLDSLEKKVSVDTSNVMQYVDTQLNSMWGRMNSRLRLRNDSPTMHSSIPGEGRAKDTSATEHRSLSAVSEPPLATGKPKLHPTPFDGSCPWDDYKAQFELVAELNGWDDSTKALYLATNLRGPAQTLLGDLDPHQRKDLTALTEALEARFGSASQNELYKAQLRGRMRGRDESLPELAQAITRLAKRAYHSAPPELLDTLARDHFLDAIPDTEFRWKIHQTHPRTLRDALTTATELEAFLAASRQRSPTARVLTNPDKPSVETKAAVSPVVDDLAEIKEMLRALVGLGGPRPPVAPSPRVRNVKCWNCGTVGHYKRECTLPIRYPPQSAGEQSSGNGNQLGHRA